MKPIYDIGITDVKQAIHHKGYVLFNGGVPNIIGIRNSIKLSSDSYDDRCFVFWTKDGTEVIHTYSITTHPGYYFLKHPIIGTRGTAILVPGQYVNCWALGMHRAVQYALCQYGGPVRVYRDSNRDITLNYDPGTIQEGYFGIDLHHGSLSNIDVIGHYSAGCQVWRYAQPHEDLMQMLKALSIKYNFTKFTYTLLEQSDF